MRIALILKLAALTSYNIYQYFLVHSEDCKKLNVHLSSSSEGGMV